MSEARTVQLPSDAEGRLDAVLARTLPAVSRRRLKAAFREGRVRHEGHRLRGSDPARPGLLLTLVDLADADRPAPAPDIDLEVVHADEALLVVEKPAGVPALPLDPDEPGTLAGAALARFPDLMGVGDLPLAPGLCHRLDVETSGLLLFARTAEAFAAVREAFRERRVDKGYLAVVAGRLEGEGVLDVPIARRSRVRMVAAPRGDEGDDPRAALTRWRALRHGAQATLIEVVIETGVTHQIRVHLAHLGHPVLGDALYGGPDAPRLALHAARLGLLHPVTGRLTTWASLRTGPVEALVGEA